MQQNPVIAEKPLAFLGNRLHDLIDDLVTYVNVRKHAGITFKWGVTKHRNGTERGGMRRNDPEWTEMIPEWTRMTPDGPE